MTFALEQTICHVLVIYLFAVVFLLLYTIRFAWLSGKTLAEIWQLRNSNTITKTATG